ncbi:MAG: lipopolysaccharide heptosyltransferase II [Deltaproteobacteria bacterium]|uniref:lipopolysaccharide heptosyltransferase II n=1 Tax=Candidatus Zymogenus saltonus TaxID=2844893 RepID=A0A9D8PNV3_9DELT|nr:lipopolysaccharide heptosyltransferase II [Candidatus Zymogenus saltonus]
MNRILVKGTNWIGDVFMSLPAVYSVRNIFPDAEIDVAVKRPLGDLFSAGLGSDVIDSVVEYKTGILGEIDLIRAVRAKRYDLGIAFPRSLHSALLLFAGGIKERVGYAADLRSPLLTKRVTRTEEIRNVHQMEYYRNLVSVLGDPGPSAIPSLVLGDEERKRGTDLLKKYGLSRGGAEGPLIGINPGAAYGIAKMWYPERFAEAADSLVGEFGGRAVVFGGPGDVEAADAVVSSMKTQQISLAGRTTVKELISVISFMDVFITNDSGPMHIAAALDVPIVAIFGSTNHVTTAPMVKEGRAKIVRRDDVECSPCLKRVCPEGHHRCMDLIEADAVVRKAREFLLNGERNKE